MGLGALHGRVDEVHQKIRWFGHLCRGKFNEWLVSRGECQRYIWLSINNSSEGNFCWFARWWLVIETNLDGMRDPVQRLWNYSDFGWPRGSYFCRVFRKHEQNHATRRRCEWTTYRNSRWGCTDLHYQLRRLILQEFYSRWSCEFHYFDGWRFGGCDQWRRRS